MQRLVFGLFASKSQLVFFSFFFLPVKGPPPWCEDTAVVEGSRGRKGGRLARWRMTPMTLVPINLLAARSSFELSSPYITMSYGCKPFKHRITRFTYCLLILTLTPSLYSSLFSLSLSLFLTYTHKRIYICATLFFYNRKIPYYGQSNRSMIIHTLVIRIIYYFIFYTTEVILLIGLRRHS